MDTLLADGFDFPVGDKNGKGNYISLQGNKKFGGCYTSVEFAEIYTDYSWIHTGEDWNGQGGGNTDLGQPVYSTAKGTVLFADMRPAPWGKIILIKHNYLENGKLYTIFSQYTHLNKILVKKNQLVNKRDKIGTIGQDPGKNYPAHLHFEIRKKSMESYPVDYWPSSNNKTVAWVKENYESPSDFINSHRVLTVPANENKILIAVKNEYKMMVYNSGKLHTEYKIALSQNPIGHKIRQGDNRLPEGEYRIIQKSRGPFSGDYAEYFGPAWIRINYPNNYDAENGYKKGVITKKERNSIIKANNSGNFPPKNTKLGGGIGIHGWINNWVADGTQNLTWGCISMHNNDLLKLYETLPLNIKIIIMP